MKLMMEKRLAPSPLMRTLVPIAAALAALVFCGIFFALTGATLWKFIMPCSAAL